MPSGERPSDVAALMTLLRSVAGPSRTGAERVRHVCAHLTTVIRGPDRRQRCLPMAGNAGCANRRSSLISTMADGEVFVIDRVVTRPGCARDVRRQLSGRVRARRP